MAEYAVLTRIREGLEEGLPVRALEFSKEEQDAVKHFHMLTGKPMLYVANVAEDDLMDLSANAHLTAIKEYAENEGSAVIVISAEAAEDIAAVEEAETEMLLDALCIEGAGPDK